MKKLLIIPLILLLSFSLAWAVIPHRHGSPDIGQNVGPQRPLQTEGSGEGGYFEVDTENHLTTTPAYDVTVIDINGVDVAYAGWDFGEGAFEQDFLVEFWLTVNDGDANAYCGLALFSAGLGSCEILDGLNDGQGLALFITEGHTKADLKIWDLENNATSLGIELEMGHTYYVQFYRDWDLQTLYLNVFEKYLVDSVTLAPVNQSIYQYFYFANAFVNTEALSIDAELSGWWITEDVF